MQICHESVKTVTGTLCSGTVVPYRRNSYEAKKNSIFQLLKEIYERHLNRNVTEAENVVLQHALHILFYRMYFKTFSAICKVRYKFLCNFKEIKRLQTLGVIGK